MKASSSPPSGSDLIYGYFRKSGLKNTAQAITRQLSFDRLRQDYLLLKGISDHGKAFSGPRSIQIDLTSECNNDCICCWCNSPLLSNQNRTKHVLEYDSVIKLIDELILLGTKEIIFSGGGEPSLHPRLLEIISYAKKNGMFCRLYTNFTLFESDSIKSLINTGLDYLVVSLWAATAQTYVALHPNKEEGTFLAIRDNLRYLAKQKGKNKKPYTRIQNIVNSGNYWELVQMEDFAFQVQADEVGFSVMDSVSPDTDSLLLSDEQRGVVLDQCTKFEGKVFVPDLEEFKRRMSASGASQGVYDRDISGKIPCYTGWFFVRVAADGSVFPCLKAHRIPVGNIHQESLRGIWNSSLENEFRRKAVVPGKADSYFQSIGNGSGVIPGCFRVCDNLTDNLILQKKLAVFPTFKLIKAFIDMEKKSKRFFKIVYLLTVVAIYSLALKAWLLLRRAVIFPGEK